MAFKMKNPSLMRMVKMAGNNRTAMKMKAEEAAMKLKKDAAMKLKKESAMKNNHDADGDGIPDTIDRDAGRGSSAGSRMGEAGSQKIKDNAGKSSERRAYGGTKTYSEGSKDAKAATGMSLNQLVAKRKGLKKGSPEYNKIQNQINKALGSKVRHEETKKKVTIKDDSGKTTIKDKKGGAEAGGRTVVKNKTEGGKTKVVTDKEGTKRSVSVTGKDTKDRSDDVKTTARRTKDGGTATRTRTATDVTKTRTDAEGKTTKSKSRKRLGKGLIKDAISNIRKKKDSPNKLKTSVSRKGKQAKREKTYTDAKEVKATKRVAKKKSPIKLGKRLPDAYGRKKIKKIEPREIATNSTRSMGLKTGDKNFVSPTEAQKRKMKSKKK
jgi:hypothetical protein